MPKVLGSEAPVETQPELPVRELGYFGLARRFKNIMRAALALTGVGAGATLVPNAGAAQNPAQTGPGEKMPAQDAGGRLNATAEAPKASADVGRAGLQAGIGGVEALLQRFKETSDPADLDKAMAVYDALVGGEKETKVQTNPVRAFPASDEYVPRSEEGVRYLERGEAYSRRGDKAKAKADFRRAAEELHLDGERASDLSFVNGVLTSPESKRIFAEAMRDIRSRQGQPGRTEMRRIEKRYGDVQAVRARSQRDRMRQA